MCDLAEDTEFCASERAHCKPKRCAILAFVRRMLCMLGMLSAACGSATPAAPTAPVTPPVAAPPPAPTIVTFEGRLTATNGGNPLGGATADFGGGITTTTDATGAYRFRFQPGTTGRLSFSGPGIVPRSLVVAVMQTRTFDADAIQESAGFDLTYYRQLVRNTLDAPTTVEPLRRWTTNPSFYMKTMDEAGVVLDSGTLDSAEQVIRAMVPAWTSGRFTVAAFDRGTATRPGTSGWINVNWSNQTIATATSALRCGDAIVGANPGTINLYYKAAQNQTVTGQCRCGGVSEMGPRVVSHELGHALGFWHAGVANDVMFAGGAGDYCDPTLSARERYHATIAYSRPVGNLDPGSDPTSLVLSLPQRRVY